MTEDMKRFLKDEFNIVVETYEQFISHENLYDIWKDCLEIEAHEKTLGEPLSLRGRIAAEFVYLLYDCDRERAIYEMGFMDNSNIPWFPGCKGCALAADGKDGYKKAVCLVYRDEYGKPTELSHEGKCEYFEEFCK